MRRRTVVIVLAVVVLVGVLIGGRAWVRGRDYLDSGSFGRFPASARFTAGSDVATVPYRDGARIVYGLTVRNHGPFSVKVTEVAQPDVPGETSSLIRVTEVRIGSGERVEPRARLPFRPFTLGRGEERYVELIAQLGDCEHWERSSSAVINRQTVRFEVLGQSLNEDVPVRPLVDVRRGAGRCPGSAAGPDG